MSVSTILIPQTLSCAALTLCISFVIYILYPQPPHLLATSPFPNTDAIARIYANYDTGKLGVYYQKSTELHETNQPISSLDTKESIIYDSNPLAMISCETTISISAPKQGEYTLQSFFSNRTMKTTSAQHASRGSHLAKILSL
jgi:hypothetical protein